MNKKKLRAWDSFNEVMVYSSEEDSIFVLENGEWSIKYIREKNMVVEGIEMDAPVWHDSDEVIVMYCIGLDKNDKDIYEGDIVKDDLITGNIYENPELLKTSSIPT